MAKKIIRTTAAAVTVIAVLAIVIELACTLRFGTNMPMKYRKFLKNTLDAGYSSKFNGNVGGGKGVRGREWTLTYSDKSGKSHSTKLITRKADTDVMSQETLDIQFAFIFYSGVYSSIAMDELISSGVYDTSTDTENDLDITMRVKSIGDCYHCTAEERERYRDTVISGGNVLKTSEADLKSILASGQFYVDITMQLGGRSNNEKCLARMEEIVDGYMSYTGGTGLMRACVKGTERMLSDKVYKDGAEIDEDIDIYCGRLVQAIAE